MQPKNLDIYGDKPLAWSRATRQLAAATKAKGAASHLTHWLATTDADGRTHLTGIGALWVDGRFYFTSGPRTRKSRNLARNPRCAISVCLRDLDLVVEGRARRIADEPTLRRLARRYAVQGWPARAEAGALTAPYSAPSAGRPPWHLYALTPATAYGVATKKPYGAMRWRFTTAR